MTTSNDAETVNYRYYRRMAWQVVRSRYAAALADAMESGTPEVEARGTAARSVRGDTRALMSELLTHATVSAILAFLAGAQEWGENGERLLEQNDLVVALIDAVEPRPPWPAPAVIGRDAAEDDPRWSAWVQAWLNAFKATGPAAAAAVGARPPNPPPNGSPASSRLQRWAPLLYSAATVAGVTAVVAYATRK